MNKHLVFLFQSSPYGNSRAKEGLDALLAASIFEQKISVVFVGDGVNQLIRDQRPANKKNLEKMLGALPMYDITEVFALEDDLLKRRLSPADCNTPVKAVPSSFVTALLNTADHVLSY